MPVAASSIMSHGRIEVFDVSFADSITDEISPTHHFDSDLTSHMIPLFKVSLSSTKISKITLLGLALCCPLLQSIELQWCSNVDDEGITCITSSCSKLQILDIRGCRISDEALLNIACSTYNLEELDISWCSLVTDVGMAA